ncbi:alpha/beta hydrolase [Brevibacillus sp. NRS-1366]|uniref:alpha/beta hydrolase n=1 Tax=Brevibacillus sp. NRS-1366 TaxID=3233899 RepID=UPI003D1B79CF
MPIDPQVKDLLQRLERAGGEPLYKLSPEEARRALAASRASINEIVSSVASVEDVEIVSPDGGIPLRIYTPAGTGPFPILVFFHGGGFVLGDLEMVDRMCRFFSDKAKCLVVSVAYRLAPEHKFPAAVEDASFTVNWVAENAARLNGDHARLAVGGESAGGNLATVVSQLARDTGGPSLVFQLLIYPVVRFDFATPSYEEHGHSNNLTIDEMKWFKEHYLERDQEKHPLASPLFAPDLSNLPPALVITAEYDPLRDEGEEYADRLRSFGVPVTGIRYQGMVHSFLNYSGEVEESKKALEEISEQLRQVFGT